MIAIKHPRFVCLVSALQIVVWNPCLIASPPSWHANLTAETRLFLQAPAGNEQDHHAAGLHLQAGGRYPLSSRLRLTAEASVRWDHAYTDPLVTDMRELHAAYTEETWRMRLGMHRVTWGASDVVSVVDIINPVDRIDWLDRPEKRGQPMLAFTIWPPFGQFDLYLLPIFRPFLFPADRSRLRPAKPVASELSLYESGTERQSFDVAMRYRMSWNPVELSLHYFEGRNRLPFLVEPADIPETVRPDAPDDVLIPFYEDLIQLGLDIQWVVADWLWKGEWAYREGYADHYVLGIGGFETPLPLSIPGELRCIAEYAFDSRGKKPTANTILDNDLFVGIRWNGMNAGGTEIRTGMLIDMDGGERVGIAQIQHRTGPRSLLKCNLSIFAGTCDRSLLHLVRKDDYLRVQWTRFF